MWLAVLHKVWCLDPCVQSQGPGSIHCQGGVASLCECVPVGEKQLPTLCVEEQQPPVQVIQQSPDPQRQLRHLDVSLGTAVEELEPATEIKGWRRN